jgi:hypothetical protein
MFFDQWKLRAKENPVLNKGLLWEYDLSSFDWQSMRGIVIARVLERGREEDFHALFTMYGGLESVRQIIKNEVRHLDDRNMDLACIIFNLKKEELQCFIRKQLKRKYLES